MFCSKNCVWGITLLRITLGFIYTMHGAQKVFGLFRGTGLPGFALWAASHDIPVWLSYTASYAELIGGFLFMIGVYPRLGGLLSMGVMIGAIYFIYIPRGFSIQNNGYEYLVVLIIATTSVVMCGSGLPLKDLWGSSRKFKQHEHK